MNDATTNGTRGGTRVIAGSVFPIRVDMPTSAGLGPATLPAMYTSVRWLNDYLDPPLAADEQAELLTRAGFPLEETEPVDAEDDVRQDFEMTSNRGDCVCHVGLAREIAALSGRTLKVPQPEPPTGAGRAADLIAVHNDDTAGCPLYTARVIRGVTVKPSPEWLKQRLRARGDIPRNNIVDITNFVLFEMGQPTHVFDLARLGAAEINIRRARPDEPFLPIGEDAREVKLTADDLVIADGEEAVAIAGVKGGALSSVTDQTTDVVIEAATFDPVSVRTSSRRHGIASESSYRFERGVHPAQIDAASRRVAELILELAGGELCADVIAEGEPIPEEHAVSMRPDRCRAILGVPVSDEEMIDALERLGFRPKTRGERIEATVPHFRLDVHREIDLIEEVGRVYGHDRIPIGDTIAITVAPPQPDEEAKRAVQDTLVGMGYVESITHSLMPEEDANLFLLEGQTPLRVDDDRAKAEPTLRPSVLPSLLRVRTRNLHSGLADLRLFELASIYWRDAKSHVEKVALGLIADIDEESSAGYRTVRGAIERIASLLCGPDATVEIVPDTTAPWLDPGGLVRIDGRMFGRLGVLRADLRQRFDLE
ncbi:MAG: phenylalanine--tRNA ligase subunit beta, partial [Planctomycetota bacterium]